jgi:DNA-binding beta-propeller fold protein YncE
MRTLSPPAAAILLLSPLSAQHQVVNWETPHVHPVELTPDGQRLLVVSTPDNRLLCFDLSGSLPVQTGSIVVGLDPVSVRARSDVEAWVVNHVSDSVSVVNLVTGLVRATLATDDEPCDVVFAGNPARAFVSCSQANTVLVFDPLNLQAPPARIPIRGEDPRALAVSPAGDQVYAAVFESGNQTTLLAGGTLDPAALPYPPLAVSDAAGPYGGVNPPPNAGAAFDPPIDAGLPSPPAVGLIVRRNAAGRWMDDNGGDWTDFVSGPLAAQSGRPTGWNLLDHDVAIIDAGTLAVSYADGLMNLNMALAVNPATGEVTVVGTDAINHVRYEPNLNGRFLRVELARFAPAAPATVALADLNPHLTYTAATIPQPLRDESVSDPRGIAWNAAGTRAYVTGMGTNNVVVLDASGARAGLAPTIAVGEGPTGLVVDGPRNRLYVLNKFEASISVVDAVAELETARIAFFDPSPPAIRAGRRHLYDARATSGTGLVSCASCHVDARMDRLSWDVGNPAGSVKPIGTDQNLGAGVSSFGAGQTFQDWHPMKGPMLTQTLQDIIGTEPLHWRGDRDGIEEFNPAFQGILGDDEQLDPAEMQEFEDFLATIAFPPNPYRNLDNSLATSLPLPGHHSTGLFSPAGTPLPNGNAASGRALFHPPSRLDGVSCVTCHALPTGVSPARTFVNEAWEPFPSGPSGEQHHALLQLSISTNEVLKAPQLRNLYERTGLDNTQLESTAGFGFIHDGSVDTIERFVSLPTFQVTSDQVIADLVAFLLSFSGELAADGSADQFLRPPGLPGLSTHAAVGRQVTFVKGTSPSPARVALLDSLLALADARAIGVVVRGRDGGIVRGATYVGADLFQTDRWNELYSREVLMQTASTDNELTFTAVPYRSRIRIGVDQDSDGWFDRDELDRGTDPTVPDGRKARPR